LKIKLESVSRAHSDVQNLMAATDVGILFLDSQLRINRFTFRIWDLFNIMAGDQGRTITDFTVRLDYDDLAADARKVLRDLTATERELPGKDGGWYLTRLKPYRTVENKIDGVVVTFVDIGERRRAEDSLRESEARMRILVGELQHRTRNLIGVVMAMVDRTAVSGQTVDEFKASFGDSLVALARVQGLLSRAAPGGSVPFDRLLESELSAQSENGGTVTLDGPPAIVLRSNSVQALAMALHELTTNAVKYEALGQKSGRLHVRWRVQAENGSPWIIVDWKESGAETAQSSGGSRGAGNGRRLIEDALPYQFGARTTFAIESDGVRCTIALPFSGPQTEEIHMASSPLRDRRILVVEDEYLIAMSLQDALENAGSVVVGPVPSVGKAIQKIESEPDIDAAVVDVNLGGLLAYPVADMLIARKIPFVFTSGYDDNVLRERYSQVKNCPKPYLFQAMEEALVEAMSLS
jgi:two-component system CheB/CheR fusion protein